jgi:predicted negative regulator of RcsB-dependent stress response
MLHNDTKPHKIEMRSIGKTSIALFHIGKKVWLASSNKNALSPPQIRGAQANEYRAVDVVEDNEIFNLFSYPLSDDLNIHVNGGGLSWDITFSENAPKEKKQITLPQAKNLPNRDAVMAGQMRGGKVFIPLDNVAEVKEVNLPDLIMPVKVVSVDLASQAFPQEMEFVDFKLLSSYAGLAIMPKVDDLEVKKVEGGVEISRPSGLALSQHSGQTQPVMSSPQHHEDEHEASGVESHAKVPFMPAPTNSFFRFQEWQMGDVDNVEANKNLLLASIGTMDDPLKTEGFITLAKMYLSHGLWAESLGAFRLALQYDPSLSENKEFRVLNAIAHALGGHSKTAFEILSAPSLKSIPEVSYWRAAVLAHLGDWEQASNVLPQDVGAIGSYPREIAVPLGMDLIEIALRKGDKEMANNLFNIVKRFEENFSSSEKASMQYLEGEDARQRGEINKTIELWEPLVDGEDNLYRTKAGLALTRLKLEQDEMTSEKATDNLEALRYVWRGDELETQVNYWLGKTYIDSGNYAKGLYTLREAASFDFSEYLRPRMTEMMSESFEEAFLGEALIEISPIEAVSMYEQFSELIPPGEKGQKIGQNLADQLSDADLPSRAAAILQKQMDFRLQGTKRYDVGMKLANLYLRSDKPDEAIRALNEAQKAYILADLAFKSEEKSQNMAIVRAEAMAQQGKVTDAISILEGAGQTPKLNRARARIAWKAQAWDDAAVALNDMIVDEDISLTKPLSKQHSDLISRYALALNLAGDRIALANAKQRFGKAMALTDNEKLFEIVTRPRRYSGLASRDQLMDVIEEVEQFEGFWGK